MLQPSLRVLLSLRGLAAGASVFAVSCGGSTTSSGKPAATSTLYVTVYGTDEIVSVNEATRAVVDHIPLGSADAGPGKGPAILLKTPDGKKLYAANWKDNTISAVDVATKAVTTIALGSRPWVEAMSPMGDVVYAGLNAGTIAVISTADDTVSRMIDTKGQLAESIIVSPDGKTLYVAFSNPNDFSSLIGGAITAISSADGSVTHPAVPVGMTPAWVTVAPHGDTVYSLNFLSNSVSAIDTATWTVAATIPVKSSSDPVPEPTLGPEPIIGAVSASGALVVTNFGTSDLVVIDPKTNAVVHSLATPGRPVGIDFSADGSKGYATAFGADSKAISPDPFALQSGNLDGAIGSDPGSIVVFDVATGTAIGDPISVGGAGPTSVVVE
jgi:YVTN family beta-propeller protein